MWGVHGLELHARPWDEEPHWLVAAKETAA
jgi:hypothetical protein